MDVHRKDIKGTMYPKNIPIKIISYLDFRGLVVRFIPGKGKQKESKKLNDKILIVSFFRQNQLSNRFRFAVYFLLFFHQNHRYNAVKLITSDSKCSIL